MFTVKQIMTATQGTLIAGGMTSTFRRVVTNSKLVKRGDLFVAIVGKKHDAHDFIADVMHKGAAGVVISKAIPVPPQSKVVIRVKDTTIALGDIARSYRERFSIPIIAVTGSAGKTTTKEMIARVLGRKFRVLKNIGTENNQFGVPQTLLKLKPSHQAAVIEVGTNQPGDIPWLASIVQPTMAVMTNIGESHLELLKTPANVFKEKFHLVKHLRKLGIAVVNSDDPYLRQVKKKTSFKTVTFSIHSTSDYQAKDIQYQSHHIQFQVKGFGRIKIRGHATSQIYNALSAMSCGRILKIGYNDIKSSLQNFSLKSGRQTSRKLGGVQIWDDSYNANPVSFRNVLEAFGRIQSRGKKVLICGDMLELGKGSKDLHAQVGDVAGQQNLDWILSFGHIASRIGKSAVMKNPQIQIFHTQDEKAMQDQIQKIVMVGDQVLIKGSRGMRMERFVHFIDSLLKARG